MATEINNRAAPSPEVQRVLDHMDSLTDEEWVARLNWRPEGYVYDDDEEVVVSLGNGKWGTVPAKTLMKTKAA